MFADKIMLDGAPVDRVLLNGEEVWSASIYPLSGEWGPSLLVSELQAVPQHTHTIAETGSYTVTFAGSAPYSFTCRITSPSGSANSPTNPSPTATWMVGLTEGDLVEFTAFSAAQNNTASGTWSIVKN